MGNISVDEFEADVDGTIARVEAGETIEITRDGRAIIEIRPKIVQPIRDAAWRAACEHLDTLLATPFGVGSGRITQDDKYGHANL